MASSKTPARSAHGKKERAGADEELDDATSALFTRPLGEFTKARDELAKRLKGSGDKEAAASVKAMRRPTVAAWTLNQLARRYPQRMDALLEAGERLREAQRGALEPGGVKELREASQEHRARVNELLRASPALLEEAGYRASGANMDRVRDSLLATPTARSADLERLSRGLVVQEIEPGDLSDVLALMRGRPAAPRAPEPKAEEKPRERREAPKAEPKKAEPKKAEPKKTEPKKAAEKPARARARVDEREEKKRRARAQVNEREAKKRRAAEEREAKKRLAAEEQKEKKRRAAKEREAKKRLAAERRELAKANGEATRAAKEAASKAKEADRLMSAAKKAAEAAQTAMDRATSAGEAAEEARARAEEKWRRAEQLERRLG